jgi:hypothetical protein
MVLVAVLLLTLATWALLAGLLTTAYLHYRLAVGADRGAIAAAAAQEAVAALAEQARTTHAVVGSWPAGVTVDDLGACELEVAEVASSAGWWRVAVRGRFEGAVGLREATVRAP